MSDSAADKMAKYMSRPSAENVAAQVKTSQTGSPDPNGQHKIKGLKCPHCHCINFSDVTHTIQDIGLTRRRRVCRNCQKAFNSYETL